ncbi:MAG: NBR1-Ig-like domain-containing protein [Myxococcota bacterium]|jgi:hypothetical protein|nr:NBR1-Ig-like domain-containing protein [Myxococcota bacterium]
MRQLVLALALLAAGAATGSGCAAGRQSEECVDPCGCPPVAGCRTDAGPEQDTGPDSRPDAAGAPDGGEPEQDAAAGRDLALPPRDGGLEVDAAGDEPECREDATCGPGRVCRNGRCADACAGHCGNGLQDCGEAGVDCGGGECAACPVACDGHCGNGLQDCGEAGVDCGGGECAACPVACDGHCGNRVRDCGESGVDCGGAGCPACAGTDDAAVAGHTLPPALTVGESTTATVRLLNRGTRPWYREGQQGYKLGLVGDETNPFLPGPGQTRVLLAEGQTVQPGDEVTFTVRLLAPAAAGTYPARFQMLLEGEQWFGEIASQDVTVNDDGPEHGCTFPQGVNDSAFTNGPDTDPVIADAVNAVMARLSGCSIGSDCPIGDRWPDAQGWFGAVNRELRDQGYCAGQHAEGDTDEIAVSSTGCRGRWYGYHVYNYGGSKVVWNPGAQRGWWSIDPAYCP